jgi:hypothetical protein
MSAAGFMGSRHLNIPKYDSDPAPPIAWNVSLNKKMYNLYWHYKGEQGFKPITADEIADK